eukprot:2300807-Pyramimonas_sp.AAC.1
MVRTHRWDERWGSAICSLQCEAAGGSFRGCAIYVVQSTLVKPALCNLCNAAYMAQHSYATYHVQVLVVPLRVVHAAWSNPRGATSVVQHFLFTA